MIPRCLVVGAVLLSWSGASQGLTGQVPLPGVTPPPNGQEAREAVVAMEDALARAEDRRVAFQVRAEGAFAADLQGELELLPGRGLELQASGSFDRAPVSVWLRSEGGRMVWGRNDDRFQDHLPHGLREGVVVGLTRMGVLHNLARLVSGAPPDRVDGTVRSWVEMEDAEWSDERSPEGYRGVRFRILVSEEPAGRATLWLDDDGLLVGRDQVVEFPGGEMRVTERYQWEP